MESIITPFLHLELIIHLSSISFHYCYNSIHN